MSSKCCIKFRFHVKADQRRPKALEEVAKLDEYHSRPKAPEHEVLQLRAKIDRAKHGGPKLGRSTLAESAFLGGSHVPSLGSVSSACVA